VTVLLTSPEFMKKILSATLATCALSMTQQAHAAGAMNVDDAQLLGAHKCQLETWGRFNRGGTERWVMPSCNVTGNLELAAGGAWQRDAQGMYMSDAQIQAKTVFKVLETNGYGIGLLAGANRQTSADDRERSWNYFAKVPMTLSLRDDDILVHANLGLNHVGAEQSTRLTWGLGNETRLLERLSFIGEVFGESKGKPSYQAGVRTVLVPEKIELDLTAGNTFGRDTQGRYVVIGLRFISPEWFR